MEEVCSSTNPTLSSANDTLINFRKNLIEQLLHARH